MTTSHSKNGRKGFDATTKKHFNGKESDHLFWLGQYGSFCYARGLIGISYWKMKAGAFRHPGPHPAWKIEDSIICIGCDVPMRDCICEILALPF